MSSFGMDVLSRDWLHPVQTLLSNKISRSIQLSAGVATVAVLYAELLFRATRWLYQRQMLRRYGPLPRERNMWSNWMNAFGFVLPSMLFGMFFTKGWSWQLPSIFGLYAASFAYMALHDSLFYLFHRTFHASRPLYNTLHAKHHEYTKDMNVFVVGFAEVSENMIQVGVPWLIWTMIASRWLNIPLLVIPMSVTIFTTLLGHSGFKMHPIFFIFHPWAAILLLPIARNVLTPGDHQMHHVYRRCNMGLFFRHCDKIGGTYRRSCLDSHDMEWWSKKLSSDGETRNHRKITSYEEVEVSFGF